MGAHTGRCFRALRRTRRRHNLQRQRRDGAESRDQVGRNKPLTAQTFLQNIFAIGGMLAESQRKARSIKAEARLKRHAPRGG